MCGRAARCATPHVPTSSSALPRAKSHPTRCLRMDRASVRSLAGLAQLEFTETSQTPDGQRLAHAVKFSSEGLLGALDSLLATCPPAKSPATPSVATPLASRDSAAK